MVLICNVLSIDLVRIHLPDSNGATSAAKVSLQSPVSKYYSAVKSTSANNSKSPTQYTIGGRVFRDVGSSINNQSEPATYPSQADADYHDNQTTLSPKIPETPIQQDSTHQSSKRSAPAHLFDDILDSSANKAKLKSRRQKLQADRDRGEFYPGATTDFPVYDMNPELEKPILRSANWVDYITRTGQEFKGGMTEFRGKLVKYAAKLGFRFNYTVNNSKYIRAECHSRDTESCMWFVRGSISSVTNHLVIKDADLKHTCPLALMTNDSKRMGQRVIGGIITEAVRSTPTLTATDLKRDIMKYWGFDIKYEKVWRGVEVARGNIFGTYDDSFDELRWYADGILRTNPGSVVALETEPIENRFKRFFVAFNASLQGFKACRPMLFVDGTFMKTRYKGTLLSATAKDGNNGLFPVAIAVVASENSENWSWFITKIKNHVAHEREIMYVSDRAGGLLNAFKTVYTKPLHFFCLYHLMKNLRAMYPAKQYSDIWKNSLCKALKDAAYAPNVKYFDEAITRFITKGGDNARHFLKDLPCEKWAVAFAPDVHRYGELTSNAAESFNSWILDARCLPVTFMLDCIRMQLMRWFTERREEVDKWTGALTPRMEEKWNQEAALGENWTIIPTNRKGVFEVLSNTTVVVDLNVRKCSCCDWQVKGFPCAHAVSCINRSRWDIKQVVEECFFTGNYRTVYAADIVPIPSTEKYEFIDLNQPLKILPPVVKRAPGRPQEHRYRAKGEPKRKRFRCGRCGKFGTHYWTTCQNAIE